MALIGTLRNKMGTWVVVFVFIAISAFIIGDIFSGNSRLMSWGRDSVGEIAGKDITYEEYQNAIREREDNFRRSTGYEPGEREMQSLRQQAWDMLVARHTIVPEYKKVGVEVTDAEVVDMVSGKNIFEGLKQSFTNQETGEFDRNQLNFYLSQVRSAPEGHPYRDQWLAFQKDLKPARERIKYENLLLKTNYVTKAEAEREYHAQTDVAEIKYLYIPYYSVSDAENVSDADLKSYYAKNKEKYRTKETRDLKYVTIPIVPSEEDSAYVRNELDRAVVQFKTSQDDSLYAVTNSDGDNAFATYTVGNLPSFINTEDLKEGNVIGPVLEGETYYVVKVSRIFTDTIATARAKHILIRWSDTTDEAKREAREKARNILKDLKAGADFTAKAREFGTDGTATRGGDLGWFNTGTMVKPFENAVFSATKPGLLNDVVETDFGYHIIEVTDVKNNMAYKLAMIERQVVPSDNTNNEAYRTAETFAAEVSGIKDFEARAKESGLTILEGKNITASDTRVGSLYQARPVVQWLYRDASLGEVSQVFELPEEIVVAVMTGIIEEGYKPLEAVKNEITPLAKKELQGKMITDKLKTLQGTLEEIAQAYGSDANVYTSSDLKLNSNSLPSVGFDPKTVGAAFSLEGAKRSAPITGENGVVIIEMQNKTLAPELNDYTSYKTILEQNAYNRSSMNIAEAIKDKANIEDKRFKFF